MGHQVLYFPLLSAILRLILERGLEMRHKIEKKMSGFTLIELMITVVVVGILAAIAYPSYTEYVFKSKRSDAKAGLVQLQLAQEKYRANCLQYATGLGTAMTCSSTVSTADDDAHNLVGSTSSPDNYYTLSISSANQTTYTLTATATGAQLGDTNCKTLSINQAGTKSSTNSSNAASSGCW